LRLYFGGLAVLLVVVLVALAAFAFADGGDASVLKLTETRELSSGIVLIYQPQD